MPPKSEVTGNPSAASDSQITTICVDSKPDAVTLYTSDSFVRRVARLSLPALGADREVHVRLSMPLTFDRDSVQVHFDAHTAQCVALRGVIVEEKDLTEDDWDEATITAKNATAERIREIEAALEENAQQRTECDLDIAAVNTTQSLGDALFENACGPALDASPEALEPTFWAMQLDAVSARAELANKTRREVEKRIATLQAEEQKLREELRNIRHGESKWSNKGPPKRAVFAWVVLNVREAVSEALLYLSYMLPGSWWGGEYEVNLHTQSREMLVRYNANVCLGGDETLEDVALTLSSAAPKRSGAPPKLEPWRLTQGAKVETPLGSPGGMIGGAAAQESNSNFSDRNISQAAVQELTGAVNFEVPSRQTLRCGGPMQVPLTEFTWKADVSYVVVPGKTEMVFAQASCVNESNFPLMRGPVAVMLDGDFVTNSFINRTAPGEKLNFNFGTDSSIEVKRKLVKKHTSVEKASLFTKEQKQRILFEYETVFQNKKQHDTVSILVRECIPISGEEKLVVRLLKPSDVSSEERRRLLQSDGIVEFNVNLKPGEETTVPFSYTVESPADVHIFGL